MPLSPLFLDVCRCPVTGQKLRVASQEVLRAVEKRRASKTLVLRALELQIDLALPIEAVLIREDNKVGYLVQDDLPVLLADHGVEIGEE